MTENDKAGDVQDPAEPKKVDTEVETKDQGAPADPDPVEVSTRTESETTVSDSSDEN